MSVSNEMRALVLKGKGDLHEELRAIPKPTEGEMLVRVAYCGICGSDLHAYHGLQPSLTFPCVMGHEIVGTIVEIHGDSDLALGDAVVIDPSFRCGSCVQCLSGKENICENLRVLGVHCDGGFAEYCLCGIDMAHRVPTGLDLDVAAFGEPMSIAVHAASRMLSEKRDKVVIIGAGPIGLALLLYLRPLFKTVLVVEMLENRREIAAALGADQVLHPLDVVIDSFADVVFDAVSNPHTAKFAERVVARGGEVIVVGLSDANTGFSLLAILKKELRISGTRMTTRADFIEALDYLKTLDSELVRRIITHTYHLETALEGFALAEKHPQSSIKILIKGQGEAR